MENRVDDSRAVEFIVIGMGATLFFVTAALCIAYLVFKNRRQRATVQELNNPNQQALPNSTLAQSVRSSYPGYPVVVEGEAVSDSEGIPQGIPSIIH